MTEPHDVPDLAGLVEAVREFLEGDVAAATKGRVHFHARVATNVLRIVERELALGPAQAEAHAGAPGQPWVSPTTPTCAPPSAGATSTTAGSRCGPRSRRRRGQAGGGQPQVRRRLTRVGLRRSGVAQLQSFRCE